MICGDCKYHKTLIAARMDFVHEWNEDISQCFINPETVERLADSPACKYFEVGK